MESSCSQSVATKSYRIRLRTLDGRSVIMGGFFPADSTMQLLADEIANLGHSDAGTFSIAFPQLANRPPAIYHPAAFNTILESCGLFSGNLTLTLARPPAAPNWSPPPPLVRGVCPRGRIDAHKVRLPALRAGACPQLSGRPPNSPLLQEQLEILHQQFPWIPGQDSIRPNPDQLRAKHESQREIDTLYDSYLAFVLIEIFGFPIVAEGHKRKADCSKGAHDFICFAAIMF